MGPNHRKDGTRDFQADILVFCVYVLNSFNHLAKFPLILGKGFADLPPSLWSSETEKLWHFLYIPLPNQAGPVSWTPRWVVMWGVEKETE